MECSGMLGDLGTLLPLLLAMAEAGSIKLAAALFWMGLFNVVGGVKTIVRRTSSTPHNAGRGRLPVGPAHARAADEDHRGRGHRGRPLAGRNGCGGPRGALFLSGASTRLLRRPRTSSWAAACWCSAPPGLWNW